MKKVILSLLCVISLTAAATTVALADDQSQYKKLKISEGHKTYKSLDLPKDTVTKFSRLTWSTNLIEWALFAPNIGVEIDLKDPTLISCPSIFLQFSYRPGKEDFMKHENFTTNALYYWRARAEYRWHFRLNERREQRRGLGKTAMWLDEKLFTKKAEDVVVDTSIIVEGGGYGTREVMSKEKRIQEKIDSTCNATNQKKPELFPGRYYLGIYGEYDNVTFNNHMIPIFGENLKSGPVYQLGLSGGYDFPGFNYNHKCFLQWSVGASLGVFWYNYDEYAPGSTKDKPSSTDNSKILPFITELKIALNFRNSTITNKYWQPDPAVYVNNIRKNHEDSIHMAELDTILSEKPVIINVTSVNGFDSAFVESVDKYTIVQAFKATTGLNYLLPTDFNMLPHTEIALNNKELSDNYFIEYVTTNRLRNYTDSVFISDRKNLPFRVQIAGREEADSLKKSFVDSLKNYYTTHDNKRPIFYGEPATVDSMKGFISKDSIAAKFTSIWGHPLDTSMIRTLYVGRNESNDDGTTTTYYDSVITEQNINRREIYAMFIQFHPQVTLSGEDEGVGRFQVAMAGADHAKEQYNSAAKFINKIARAGIGLRIQRFWDGREGDGFSERVTKEEVVELMQNYGLDSVDVKNISISDSIYEFTSFNENNPSYNIAFNFGVTEEELNLPFSVSDSIGRAQAYGLYNDTIRPWLDERYWMTNMGLYDDDPKVPGYYDSTEGQWLVSIDKFIEAVGDITFAHIKPYQVDTLVWKVQATPYKTGNYAGKYRAQAHMIFHRELRGKSGLLASSIPYLLVPVETKEEAGFVEPAPEVVDSTATAMRDSVVYTYDSLGNIIDSTIIQVQVEKVAAMMRDSVVYAYDSLGNIIDSTIIQIEVVNVANDSILAKAAAEVVDTVKIVTVEEATAASKEAAALAKSTAAEAKKATSEAKKAAAAAKKAQKSAAAAIKKAEKSVNVPDSVVISSDSIVYEKDSLGNVIDSTVVTVEKKIANELDSATLAAIAVRDSIIAAEQAVADSITQRADSLQAVADELSAKAAEAKTAAAEAKKAIAEAKKVEKAAAAEAKKRAKEEAKAAKSGKSSAKKAKSEATEAVSEATSAVVETATSQVANTTEVAATTVQTTVSNVVSETVADTDKVLTVEEATAASKEAAELAKTTAAEAKAAAAAAKKATAEVKKAEKAAAAAIKKAEKAVTMPEEGAEIDEETQAAIAVRDSIIAAEQAKVDSLTQQATALQTVADEAAAKAAEAKTAAANAKKAIAEAKKAEKAAAAEAKKRAKEEAAAAKAAAKAEADAAKEAAKAEAESAAETVNEAATEVATSVENVAADVEKKAEEATIDTTGMSEKEIKAAQKAAAAEAKKKAKEEAAAAKAAAKAEAAAKKAAAAEAKKKAKEEAAAAKAAAKAEAAAAKEAAKAAEKSAEESTEAKE